MPSSLPDKQFFKIGEAADIVGVKAHVLRYWESEFPSVRPLKTRGSHRMYRRVDVEVLCLIRRLLHEEGYTIPGARKRVAEMAGVSRGGPAPAEAQVEAPSIDAQASRELRLRAELLQVRRELDDLLVTLDRQAQRADATPPQTGHVTVTAVVPKTVLMHPRIRD
jgi:DNA-binding transcriptional MerR regulator